MCCNKILRALYIICSLFVLGGCSVPESKAESTVDIINDSTVQYPDNNESVEEAASNVDIWEEVKTLIENRKYPQAISVLSKMEDYRAYDLEQQLRYLISGDYIASLMTGVAAIDKEGKVRIKDAFFKERGYAEVREWTGIERLSYDNHGLDALSSEGVFFTTHDDEDQASGNRNEKLRLISNISIFETSNSTCAVTDQSGRLYLYNEYQDYLNTEAAQKEIAGWTDIVDLVTGGTRVAALHRDGTVSFVYANKLPGESFDSYKWHMYSDVYDDVHEWTDIVDISGGGVGHLAALKADGTVLISNRMRGMAKGENYDEVSQWTDIIAISKSPYNIMGLKSDGTVVTAGLINEGQKRVTEWTDIVAISAEQDYHVGLKSDGTLVVAGESGSEKWTMPDVSDIKDLYVPTVNLNW